MPFDPETGKSLYNSEGEDYGTVTCNYLLEKMQADKSVCAITSATPTVFGFTPDVRKKAGKQFMDVGIAEEHAMALASGIAKEWRKAFLRRLQLVLTAYLRPAFSGRLHK